MKKSFLFMLLPLMFAIFSCAVPKEKVELVGLGHTFRDLRQHTFSTSGNIKNTFVDISPDGQLMAFVVEKSGNQDIYVKPVNSKAMIQKTFHRAADAYPSFSPDGKKLAFASMRNGNWDIFVMNVGKGKAKRQISSSNEQEIAPSWSPDGTKTAFCRFSTSSGQWEIWTYDLTNGALTNLVPGKFPKYHPKANIIVFQRASRPQASGSWYALWTIDDEGNEETLIISSEEEGYINPDWSFTGDRIVFASGGKCQKVKKSGQLYEDSGVVVLERKANDIWTISVDGTNLTQLTCHQVQDWAPEWSSDRRIFFASERDKYQNIWSVIPEFVEFAPKE